MPQSPNKGYELQVTGTNTNTWGDVLNDDTISVIDENLGGTVTKTLSNVQVDLNATESQALRLVLNGTLTGNVLVTTLAVGMVIVDNQCTGGFSVTFQKNGVGTPVALPNGTTNMVTMGASGDPKIVGEVPASGPLAISEGGTGEITAAAAFSALKQTADETNTGVVDLATDAEIRAATTGAHAIMASDLESAAALVTITDGATITPDWDAFINGQITLAGNRTLNVPTNLQTGTWRTIWIQGNDGTDRTITLGAGYLGPNVAVWNALTFNSSTKRYIMSIFALNSSNAVILGAPLGPF